MTAVRVGVIGGGFGANVMAPAFAGTDDVEVVGVVSPRDRAAVAELCRRDDVDLISVHSAPAAHEADVVAALEHGRHVLCDKPFGADLEAARRMAGLGAAADALCLLNFELRYEPWRRLVTSLIDAGTIGAVEAIDWHESRPNWRVRPRGWQSDRAAGGGWLGASVSHTLDAIRLWAGRPEIASAAFFGGTRSGLAETGCALAGITERGARFTVVSAGADARLVAPRVVISGTEATFELRADGGLRLDGATLPPDAIDAEWGPETFMTAVRTWCALVRDAVVTGDAAGLPTFADGLACAELLADARAKASWAD